MCKVQSISEQAFVGKKYILHFTEINLLDKITTKVTRRKIHVLTLIPINEKLV